MRLSGLLPVVGRRVAVALGVIVMLTVPAQAQTAPAAAAQPEPPDQLKFASTTPVMVLLSIKPGQEATFEQGWAEMKAGLAAAKPEHQAQAKSMQLMKVDLAAAGQPVIYIMYLDPPVTDLSYDITKIHYYGGAFDVSSVEGRKKVDDLYAKFTASLAGQNVWPIIKK